MTLTDTTLTTTPYPTNGQVRTWTYTWANFLPASVKSPRTDVNALTKFTYDSTGALTSITNALNQTIQITRHLSGGLPQIIVDPNGVTTNLTYDARQRLLSIVITTSAGVRTNSYTYDPAGNLLTTTQPDGSSFTNTYDASHRLTRVADKLGDSITYTLDAFGDRTQVTVLNPSGSTQLQRSGAFDALGRILQSIGGASQTTRFTYDGNGNLLKQLADLSGAIRRSNPSMYSTDGSGAPIRLMVLPPSASMRTIASPASRIPMER